MSVLQRERVEEWIQARPILLAASLACVVAALWALIEALGSYLPGRYSPYQTVWMRYATHLLFLVLVWGPRRRLDLIKTPRWKGQILRGLLMLGMPTAFILAARGMDVHAIWDIFWIAPLAGMAAAVLLFKQNVSISAWAAAVLGWVGTLFIFRPKFSGGWQQILLTLGMTACFILYVLATRHMASERTLTSLFYTAFVVFLPLSFVMPKLWVPLNWKAAAIMIMIGLVGLALLFALDRALELAPVAWIAPFFYSQAIWYLLFNVILHHTPVHLADLGGAVMVLVSVAILAHFLLYRPRRRIAV